LSLRLQPVLQSNFIAKNMDKERPRAVMCWSLGSVYCDLMGGFGQIFSAAVDGILDGYGGISWKPVFAENLTYVLVLHTY